MITAIAIDDEPKALEIIQLHVAKVPFLKLVGIFREALSAIAWLQDNHADLVFLDINMPHLSGLNFRELAGNRQLIIFTTAYSEYAVESYEQNATDYLLKPIQFPRFLQAVLKAKQWLELKNKPVKLTAITSSETFQENNIYIKSGTKKFKVNTNDILYLEKDGNYIYFHLPDKKIISRMNMQQVLNILPEGQFIRVHKSWIIAVNHVESIKANQITIKNTTIPIGKKYQIEVLKIIGQ